MKFKIFHKNIEYKIPGHEWYMLYNAPLSYVPLEGGELHLKNGDTLILEASSDYYELALSLDSGNAIYATLFSEGQALRTVYNSFYDNPCIFSEGAIIRVWDLQGYDCYAFGDLYGDFFTDETKLANTEAELSAILRLEVVDDNLCWVDRTDCITLNPQTLQLNSDTITIASPVAVYGELGTSFVLESGEPTCAFYVQGSNILAQSSSNWLGTGIMPVEDDLIDIYLWGDVSYESTGIFGQSGDRQLETARQELTALACLRFNGLSWEVLQDYS